mgnify:CR=1 FL=1
MSGRILVVDDEPNLRELLRIVLEGDGHFVLLAATFREAMEVLTKEQFDLVICDIFLPDGNGLDLLPKFEAIPSSPEVIIMTGHGSDQDEEEARRLGAFAYLRKPIDINQLMETVRNAGRTHGKGD